MYDVHSPVRGFLTKSRRSSDRWLLRGLFLGWFLIISAILFLILVWLDASIAGRVLEFLIEYTMDRNIGFIVEFNGGTYGNYW